MSGENQCWLCKANTPLCDSHIIPKFVFRWLIETGGTPYLRQGSQINRRVQDGDKHKLYCEACEQLISKFEGKARVKLFAPATRSEKLSGWYGPWLAGFAASLAIRTIHSLQFRSVSIERPLESSKVGRVETNWRNYLLGKAKSPGLNSLYLLYPGYFTNFDAEGLPQNWNRFIHRVVERDLIFSESGSFCATYTKLGPLIILGKVANPDNYLSWNRIACSEGRFTHPFPVNGTLWNLLLDRARNARSLLDGLSDAQANKIDAQIAAYPDRFLESDTARRMLGDIEQINISKPER